MLLSTSELQLKRDVKARLLGLTVVEKLRAKQASRLVSIYTAEANEKLFYIPASGRQRKNHISSIQTDEGSFYAHEAKVDKLFLHYSTHFVTPVGCHLTLGAARDHQTGSVVFRGWDHQTGSIVFRGCFHGEGGQRGHSRDCFGEGTRSGCVHWPIFQEKLGNYKG